MFSNMFWIKGNESVYFNIKEEGSVIQSSLKGGECNLLILESKHNVHWTYRMDKVSAK